MSAAGTQQKVIPNEVAMQQAWRFRLWGAGRIKTTQGINIQILDPGIYNTGSGPDFKDARVRVGDELWVGSVEIHRKASDWYRHGHDRDEAYRNVVLHIVGEDDCRIDREDRSEVLQAVMEISPGFENMFNGLMSSPRLVLPMCGNSIRDVESIFRVDWITALAFERLIRKADDVAKLLEMNNGNWIEVSYIMLARGLGLGANADNMERLARSLPFRYLLRHSDSQDTVEGLLFGRAGLLNAENPADYHEADLLREFNFYFHKYHLPPISRPIWHLSARNVANTPYRRIALLSTLICKHGADIAHVLCELCDTEAIKKFLEVDIPEYWRYSYSFGREVKTRMSALGKQSFDLLIINVLAPLVYCRGLKTGNVALLDGAMQLWMQTAGERNNITYGFEKFGIESNDAFTSQALIQLHREYCERRRCTECRIGHKLLSSYIKMG